MEPNIGEASPIHCKVSDPRQLQHQHLVDYIDGHNADGSRYSQYYPRGEEWSRVFVHDKPLSQTSEQTKIVSALFDDEKLLTPDQFSFMMQHNCLPTDLTNLVARLKNLSQSALHNVLDRCPNYTKSPIILALSSGHVSASKAYGELLKLVNDKKVIFKLLDGEVAEIDKCIWSLIGDGSLDAYLAYCEIKSKLLD